MSERSSTERDSPTIAPGFDLPFAEMSPEAVRMLVEPTITSERAAEQFSATSVFKTLRHPGRRYVLTYLLKSDGLVTLSQLVDYVIAQTDSSMTDREFRERITAELTHTHLPKLADEGYVEYNLERQIIGPTDLTPLVGPYLALALAQQHVATAALDDDVPFSL